MITSRSTTRRTSRATASARLSLGMVGPEHTIVPLTAGLHYTSADPYAIRMTFNAGTGERVQWLLARDLLRDALVSPQGLGDVQAWPSAGEGAAAGPAVVHIEMSSPFGHARLQASALAVAAFLERTYAIVPAGREPEFVDFDAELTELLSQA